MAVWPIRCIGLDPPATAADAGLFYLNSRCRLRLDSTLSFGGAARPSGSSAWHSTRHAAIAVVRSGKSTRLWTRIAAEEIAAARANLHLQTV